MALDQEEIRPSHPPKNYLVESILVLLFCCMPFGIVAIINAAKVNTEFERGNYAGAKKASEEAQKWMKYGIIGGLVGLVFYALYIVLIIASEGGF